MNYTKILKKCVKIADERQSQYGEASDGIKSANSILKAAFGINITEKEFCYVIIALKLSRQKEKHKDDNILDIINYLAISFNL